VVIEGATHGLTLQPVRKNAGPDSRIAEDLFAYTAKWITALLIVVNIEASR